MALRTTTSTPAPSTSTPAPSTPTPTPAHDAPTPAAAHSASTHGTLTPEKAPLTSAQGAPTPGHGTPTPGHRIPTPASTHGSFRATRQTGRTLQLLRLGALAGPFYVTVALSQALTREGFDLSRHPWSFLANGDLGWIQTTNFILTALATIAFAIGLRRTLTPLPIPTSAPAPTPTPVPSTPASGRGRDSSRGSGHAANSHSPSRGSRWAPRLIAAFGASMLGAAAFPADPAMGFPTGTPEGPGAITLAGTMHMAVGGVGFLCLVAACYVLASRFTRSGERGWAIYTRITGTLFLGAFLGIATGGAIAWANLIFVAAIIAVWCWMSLLSIKLSRNA